MIKPLVKSALLELHSIVGLVLALLLAVIGVTGAIMSFEDEIQASLNAPIMRVEARTTPKLTPDALISRVQADQGPSRVAGLVMSSDPDAAARIRFARDADRVRPSSLYVDPYDGHVLGAPQAEDFFATVRRLHRWLLIPGDNNGYGRQITGVAVLGLLALMISGLVLRWPHRAGSIRIWLRPNLALTGRGLHRSLHTVVGTWVLPIYLVIALTGLWYSFDWYKSSAVWLLSRADQVAAAPRPARGGHGAEGHLESKAEPVRLDRVWAAFLQAEGEHFTTAQLMLPQGAGTIVRVRSWPAGAADGARDEFRIDAATGQIVSSERYADKTVGERILARVLDIHRGSILGWPGKLLFMIAAGLMPLFAVTGALLYLSSRRHRRMMRQAPLPRLVPGE